MSPSLFEKLVAGARFFWIRNTHLSRLNRAAGNPQKTQEAVLRSILRKNSKTDFGTKHGFADIRTLDDFQRRVPIQNYEDLRPFIDAQIQTGKPSIVPGKPLIYMQTSGTTGKPKYIPVIRETIDAYKRAQDIFAYVQYAAVPGIFSGKILAIVSPAIEGYVSDGTPYGSMSGVVYKNMPVMVSRKYVLPPQVFEVSDYDSKYKLIAALAAREKDISAVATANPSTFIKINDILHQNLAAILAFIETGNLSALPLLLTEDEKKGLGDFKPAPARAKELAHLFQQNGRLRPGDIWPSFKAIITWTKGNGALLIPRITNHVPAGVRIIEMGYLASEFRGTITIDCKTNAGLPTLEDNFFEFIEKDDWDNGIRDTIGLHELKAGKRYYIIVTALHGLYRYFINDIIEVTGSYKQTPTISFVQKGRGVTNITGEKLYEEQVIEAVSSTMAQLGIKYNFFVMLANPAQASYILHIESAAAPQNLAERVDEALGRLNIEYAAKLKSGRLRPLTVQHLKSGAYDAYKKHCIAAGQREAQFKILHLQYDGDTKFSFGEHAA